MQATSLLCQGTFFGGELEGGTWHRLPGSILPRDQVIPRPPTPKVLPVELETPPTDPRDPQQ